jgi:hypothetical protein
MAFIASNARLDLGTSALRALAATDVDHCLENRILFVSSNDLFVV